MSTVHEREPANVFRDLFLLGQWKREVSGHVDGTEKWSKKKNIHMCSGSQATGVHVRRNLLLAFWPCATAIFSYDRVQLARSLLFGELFFFLNNDAEQKYSRRNNENEYQWWRSIYLDSAYLFGKLVPK